MNVTINDMTLKSEIDSSDFIPIWDSGAGEQKKITNQALQKSLGLPQHVGMASGSWYMPPCTSVASSAVVSPNSVLVSPLAIPFEADFAEIGVGLATSNSSANVYLGVYKIEDDVFTELLGQGIFSFGGQTNGSIQLPLTLAPGMYGLAISPSASITIRTFGDSGSSWLMGRAGLSSSAELVYLLTRTSFDPLPFPISPIRSPYQGIPAIMLRAL